MANGPFLCGGRCRGGGGAGRTVLARCSSCYTERSDTSDDAPEERRVCVGAAQGGQPQRSACAQPARTATGNTATAPPLGTLAATAGAQPGSAANARGAGLCDRQRWGRRVGRRRGCWRRAGRGTASHGIAAPKTPKEGRAAARPRVRRCIAVVCMPHGPPPVPRLSYTELLGEAACTRHPARLPTPPPSIPVRRRLVIARDPPQTRPSRRARRLPRTALCHPLPPPACTRFSACVLAARACRCLPCSTEWHRGPAVAVGGEGGGKASRDKDRASSRATPTRRTGNTVTRRCTPHDGPETRLWRRGCMAGASPQTRCSPRKDTLTTRLRWTPAVSLGSASTINAEEPCKPSLKNHACALHKAYAS